MTEHYILSNFLKASKTFDIYQDVFATQQIDHVYRPLELSTQEQSSLTAQELTRLEQVIHQFRNNPRAESIVVSNPFKQYVPKLCDKLDISANQMQTVNLIVKNNGILLGMNLDGEAFFQGQKAIVDYDFKNRSVLLLGSGGVSTAIAFKLSEIGVGSISLFDIRETKQQALSALLSQYFPGVHVINLNELDESVVSEADVVYNGTGIGKKSNRPESVLESPLRSGLYPKRNAIAVDANYTPWMTQFLIDSLANGCLTLNGFSHMIAFTALHLSTVLNQNIPFSMVYAIGKRHI